LSGLRIYLQRQHLIIRINFHHHMEFAKQKAPRLLPESLLTTIYLNQGKIYMTMKYKIPKKMIRYAAYLMKVDRTRLESVLCSTWRSSMSTLRSAIVKSPPPNGMNPTFTFSGMMPSDINYYHLKHFLKLFDTNKFFMFQRMGKRVITRLEYIIRT
jgi:hypothetical protein